MSKHGRESAVHASLAGANRLIGFSAKIHDPAFDKYKADSRRWSYLFSVILAIIAIVGFPIYGSLSREIKMPESLYMGLGIGGMFIAIAFFQNLKRKNDSTWDGSVVDKSSQRRRRHNDNSGAETYYTEYIVKVRRDDGKVVTHKTVDLPGLYEYYNVGDRVRHHKGLYYYEKYDKSRDSRIVCAACLTMNDINGDYCNRCKCPLLK